MATVKVDFSAASYGKVRPLHGVNQGPMTQVFTYDATPWFKEAGIPYCRLHDTEYPYGSGEFVDIPCIFKNFDADENLEENYNFGLTDEYLRAIYNAGSEPLFRLGVSIEHAPVKRYIYPPKDFGKWARICEHIIAHYTEGWANGYEWNIRYWEIYNEADGHGNMWLGTPEQFYELYCVTARHLKARFPKLMIGGCGWTRARNEFTEGFMKYISTRDEYVPLDFFSWHRYFSQIKYFTSEYKESRYLLDTYGYPDAENIFDEWNYMENWNDQPAAYVKLKSHIGGAYCAAVLAVMQEETDIDVATYFEGDVVKEWCGLFDVDEMSIGAHGRKASVKPLTSFYAFKAFNECYKLKNAVRATSDTGSVYACAASSDEKVALLVSNYGGEDTDVTLELSGLPGTAVEIRINDETRLNEKIMTLAGGSSVTVTLPMKNNSFISVISEN